MDQFSNDFASHWDELVGWEKRSEADTVFLLDLLQKQNCRTVLDVALGTGFHSIKLLEANYKVKSVDISSAMIEVAKNNAKQRSVALDVLCADWVDLSSKLNEKFDCILCLGNSFACEMNSNKRQAAISNWSKLLNDDGIIIVDRRNYESLLKNEYDLSAKGQYFGETVQIKPTSVTPQGTVFSYTFSDGRTFDLKMYPILDEHMQLYSMQSGLEIKEIYGDRILGKTDKNIAFYLYVIRKRKNA